MVTYFHSESSCLLSKNHTSVVNLEVNAILTAFTRLGYLSSSVDPPFRYKDMGVGAVKTINLTFI